MSARSAWERFWFAPIPASTLAAVRIGFAAVLLAWAATLAPDMATLYGPDGVVSGSRAYPVAYAGLIAGGACLLVGYRPRIAAVAVFVSLVWFDRVNPWSFNSGDALLRYLAFVLMMAPSSAALSIDRVRAGEPLLSSGTVGAWSLRLIQIQLSLLYIAAAGAKLQGEAWREGIAASLALGVPNLTRFPLPDVLTGSVTAAHALTWGTIGLEAAIGILVWSRRLRPWVLGTGVCFHLLIDYSLRAGFFSWAILVAYVAFVPPATMDRLIDRRRLFPRIRVPASRNTDEPLLG